MEIREIKDRPTSWNTLATHPLQTWEWGEFRALTGVGVVRYGIFTDNKLVEPVTITIHPIPHTPFAIGYYPKGGKLTQEHKEILKRVAKKYHCVYVKCEPMWEQTANGIQQIDGYKKGRALFTPHNFVLDVTRSEEELLSGMKQKTRYNIRMAEKKGVVVEVDNSEEAFERYLELTKETTERQGFYAHSEEYQKKMWEEMRGAKMAELLVAKYEGKMITTWVLFTHNGTLYYPYGASSREYREVMANNLVMWEAIKLAKQRGLRYLDMWGALGTEPDKADPWYGFHKFKEGYGGRHVSYVGSFDYVASPLLYYPLRIVEELRWKYLRLRK